MDWWTALGDAKQVESASRTAGPVTGSIRCFADVQVVVSESSMIFDEEESGKGFRSVH